jgi:Histidinol dehydrogenase
VVHLLLTAKSMISDQTGIDMLAGPTELGIIADNSANPKFIALDLISQAEHSNDTFCYLITHLRILQSQ